MSSVKHILKQQAEEEQAEAEGERRPLVYVDDVGSYSDLDGSRRRRRKSVALVLTVVCVAVGLSLAVALPFVTLSGGPSRDEEAPVALQSSLEQEIDQPVQLIPVNIIPKTEELEKTTEEDLLGSSAPSDFSTSSSSSQELTSDAPTPTYTPTHTPTPSPSPTLDPFFSTCPEVPEHRRGFVDLEFLRGKLLFEVFRIQTEQSPASVAGGGGISCSVAELDFSSSEDGRSNETTSADGQQHPSHGTMTLRYMEGRSFFSRTLRRVQVNLTEATSSPRDFVESFGHGGQGRLSFLVQADVFVLTYECFPSYPGDLRPGYVVHVYSLLPPPPSGGGGGGEGGDKAEGLGRALLRLAGVWGLNPGRRPVVEVGQRFCNR